VEVCWPYLLKKQGFIYICCHIALNLCHHFAENGGLGPPLLAASDSWKLAVIQKGALPALLQLLNVSSSKGVQKRAAEGVRVLMAGVLNGKEYEKVAKARAKALPVIIKLLDGTPSLFVGKKLDAALEAFSPGAAEKVSMALEGGKQAS
jgi:hypothetical protein